MLYQEYARLVLFIILVTINISTDFEAIFIIRKKSKFDWNQLKLSMQHKNMYMHQEKIIKMEKSLLFSFGEIWPRTMY